MITLSNGYKFEYIAASGALGYDGSGYWWEKPLKYVGLFDTSLFTVVTKTITRLPAKGNFRWYNPLGAVRLIDSGTVNAIGLTNPGFDWWLKKYRHLQQPLIVSITGSEYDLAYMADKLRLSTAVGIEFNASCPNVKTNYSVEDIVRRCRAIKNYTDVPLILKMSVVHDVDSVIDEVSDLVDAFSINSVPWNMVYDVKSPLSFGGSVSGKAAQRYTWALLSKIVAKTDIPVIGPSVWDYEDIQAVRKLGASAIGFGSVFLRYPWRPTQFVRRDNAK